MNTYRERERERITEWCLKESGISKRFYPADREYSHQTRADSPQTHVKLAQPLIRKKLLDSKERYPQGIPEWWTADEDTSLGEKSEYNLENNGKIMFKPQVPLWDFQ